MKNIKNVKNKMIGYAENNNIKDMHNYIKIHGKILKDISSAYGVEVNPIFREIYNTAFQHEHYKFASEYQNDIQTLLGENILFIDE